VHIVAVEFYTGWERRTFDDLLDALDYAEHWVGLGHRVFRYTV